MKNTTLFLFLSLLIASCKKEKTAEPISATFDASQATLISQGSFSSNAHPTSGAIKLYKQSGQKILVFENFKTDSGPDLKVYLSKTTNNVDVITLGALKSTSGNFNYQMDSAINTNTYNYVLIWCEDFSVLFGNSRLQ